MGETDIQGLEQVLDEYGISVYRSEFLKENVLALHTDRGPLCLKRVNITKDRMEYISAALAFLAERGFNKMAQPIPTVRGCWYAAYGGQIYFMTRWLEGHKSNFKDLAELSAVTRTLAQFHNRARGIPLARQPNRFWWVDWPEVLQQRCQNFLHFADLARQSRREGEFPVFYRQVAEVFYIQGKIALKRLAGSAYYRVAARAREEGTFVHRDVAARNFIITPDEGACLIDFDYSSFDTRVTDIVRLLERSLKKHHWKLPVAQLVLETYGQESSLDPGEMEVALVFLEFPHKFWRLAHSYFLEEKSWPDEVYTKKLLDLVRQQEAKNLLVKELGRYCDEGGLTGERQ